MARSERWGGHHGVEDLHLGDRSGGARLPPDVWVDLLNGWQDGPAVSHAPCTTLSAMRHAPHVRRAGGGEAVPARGLTGRRVLASYL